MEMIGAGYLEVCWLLGSVLLILAEDYAFIYEWSWLLESVLVTWKCAGYLEVCWLLGSVLVTWTCAGYLEVCWLLGSVLVTWKCAIGPS